MEETPQNSETSNSLETSTSNTNQIKIYEHALQLAFYEGQISWQMNILFIGLNVGIGTILQDKLEDLSSHYILLLIMSAIGLIINVLWLGTFHRNNKYYTFRLAQARNAEPNDYQLVDQRGYRFTQGDTITFLEKSGERTKFKLTPLEFFTTNKKAVLWSIYCFIIVFAALFIFSSYIGLKTLYIKGYL